MAVLTRRAVLTLGGAAGLLALAGPAQAATATADVVRARTTAIGDRASFTRLLGQTVSATGSHGSHRLRLIQISDVGGTAAGSARSFNLIFSKHGARSFAEGIYLLTGSDQLRVWLLLNSIGSDGRIQALINRGH